VRPIAFAITLVRRPLPPARVSTIARSVSSSAGRPTRPVKIVTRKRGRSPRSLEAGRPEPHLTAGGRHPLHAAAPLAADARERLGSRSEVQRCRVESRHRLFVERLASPEAAHFLDQLAVRAPVGGAYPDAVSSPRSSGSSSTSPSDKSSAPGGRPMASPRHPIHDAPRSTICSRHSRLATASRGAGAWSGSRTPSITCSACFGGVGSEGQGRRRPPLREPPAGGKGEARHDQPRARSTPRGLPPRSRQRHDRCDAPRTTRGKGSPTPSSDGDLPVSLF
jgi:hypothetical protein